MMLCELRTAQEGRDIQLFFAVALQVLEVAADFGFIYIVAAQG